MDEGEAPGVVARLDGGDEQAVRGAGSEQPRGEVADADAVAEQCHRIAGDDLDDGEGDGLALLISPDGNDAELMD